MERLFSFVIVMLLLGNSLGTVAYAQNLGNNAMTGTENGHEWVDLGLSVKWATCNVGASSPSDYGDYFAWGETTPKSEYTWESYRFRVTGDSGGNVTFSKYNPDRLYGYLDLILDVTDDAASANWSAGWRMPTDDEWKELINKCTWTWTTLDGQKGYKVTSKKNGNSIFLPAAGNRIESSLFYTGSLGSYWSSSLRPDRPSNAWRVKIDSSDVNWYGSSRYLGFSVRPVTQ